MKNKQLAIDTIRNDCTLMSQYLYNTPDGVESCAIGGLYLAATDYTDPSRIMAELADYRLASKSVIHQVGPIAEMTRAITDKFGLSINDQQIVQAKNDGNMWIYARRMAIINYLESLPDDDDESAP